MDRIGIVRGVDKLGRVCIPKEMRELFGLQEEVEITLTEEGVLLRNPEYILVKKSELVKKAKGLSE